MKKIWITLIGIFLIAASGNLFAQINTSNKGTDFWLGYMDHIDGVNSFMSLYITSDVSTSGTVDIPNVGWSFNFTVTANTTTVVSIPPALAYVGCSDCTSDAAIHVVSNDPIVVYSHIFSSPRSDATLVLPVPTLGKEYWVMSYPQHVNLSGQKSVFLIVAVEDNTDIEITPSSVTLGGFPAGVPFNISLNQGQMYQVESTTDLTGSKIISQGGTGSCKRIAVFSGSTFNRLGCSNASTGDNLYEQCYPFNAWGNEFVTVPFKTKLGDIYRVLAGTNGTMVNMNGILVATLNAGQIWDTLNAVSNYISTSDPVAVAQFQVTENCDGITGDPSMVILSPVEQTLDTITLYSSPFMAITGQYINVVIETSDTSTFTLDGFNVPFLVCPNNSNYSYSQNTVISGNHTLLSDSGFTATAYGMGSLESYAYNAGANVKNLQQGIVLNNNSFGNISASCPGTEIAFAPITSYVPISWLWYFGDGDTSSLAYPLHTYPSTGDYTVSLITQQSGVAGCNAYDSSAVVIHIVENPTALFSVIEGCLGDTSFFTNLSTAGGSNFYSWKWHFGDGDSSFVSDPDHIYYSSGTFQATLVALTDIGCVDSVLVPINILPLPNVFAGNDTLVCIGETALLSASGAVQYLWTPSNNLSSTTVPNPSANPNISQYYFVEGTDLLGCSARDSVFIRVHKANVNAGIDQSICPGTITTLSGSGAVNYSWSPVQTLTNSAGQSVQALPIAATSYYLQGIDSYNCKGIDTVHIYFENLPDVNFTSNPNSGPWPLEVFFTNQSSGAVSYVWNFGDGDSSSIENPVHIFMSQGSFEVSLKAYSEKGCYDTLNFRYILTDNTNQIIVPNIFTPNGDGENDFFKIQHIGFSELNGEIFNRWGTMISKIDFISEEGWNGSNLSGLEMQDGTYFYILRALGHDNQTQEFSGFVELLRSK